MIRSIFIILISVMYATASLEIAGGNNTDISLYPWQVSVQFLNTHFCGGFLISTRWVATAAHCLVHGYSAGLNIRAGSTLKSSGGQTVTVGQYFLHPDYNATSENFDIALLELDLEVVIEENVAPAVLPDSGHQVIPDGALVTVTGWGSREEGGPHVETLQEVQVPIVSQEECRAVYGGGVITDDMFCAGYLGVGQKDSCGGDSGGPVVLDGMVIGIVSFGRGCASPVWPGVYTKMSSARSWIKEIAGV